MTPEEDDDLWELLGNDRPTKVSPFFARNVLRQIRAENAASAGVTGWFRGHWRLLAGASCAGLAVVTLWPRLATESPSERGVASAGSAQPAASEDAVQMDPPAPTDSLATLAEVVGTSPDLAVIGNLDELLAAEESSAWLTHPVF